MSPTHPPEELIRQLEAALCALEQAHDLADPLRLTESTPPLEEAVRHLRKLAEALACGSLTPAEKASLSSALDNFRRQLQQTEALHAGAASFAYGWLRTLAELCGSASAAYGPDGEAEQTNLPSRVFLKG